mmetsp:Transcript_24811/g.36717  ORF Transcript_24811/g.36717 Transcript_24811/m.36717 type:complete len:231 (-) Transcript_24811:94-786(-)
MDIVKSILEKNNEGVKCIRNGCYDDARQAFKIALSLLKKFYERHLSNQESYKYRHPPLDLVACTIPNFQNKNLCYGAHYIYQNALLAFLDRNSKTEDVLKRKKRVCLTALITFNLSLAYHCKAHDQFHSRSDYIKVLRLYKSAWNALQTDPSVSIKEQMSSEVVALGILNNMGVVFHELASYEHARYCFTTLRHVLLSKSASVLSLTTEARDGMVMNALFQEEEKTAAAA